MSPSRSRRKMTKCQVGNGVPGALTSPSHTRERVDHEVVGQDSSGEVRPLEAEMLINFCQPGIIKQDAQEDSWIGGNS